VHVLRRSCWLSSSVTLRGRSAGGSSAGPCRRVKRQRGDRPRQRGADTHPHTSSSERSCVARFLVQTSWRVLLTAGVPPRSSTLRTRRARLRRARRSGPARAPCSRARRVVRQQRLDTCSLYCCPPRGASAPGALGSAARRATLRYWMPHGPCDRRRLSVSRARQVLRHPQRGQRRQVRQVRQVVLQRAHHRHGLVHRPAPGAAPAGTARAPASCPAAVHPVGALPPLRRTSRAPGCSVDARCCAEC
jgi:hypothetical protein